jgi:hypothetical protein
MALTREERLRLVQAEVQQHRPAGEQEVIALEFRHPAFPADEIPRVVHDNAELEARLETGETVIFLAAAFSAIGPAAGENRWPKIELSVDGVSAKLEPWLNLALGSPAPIEVIFREYIRSWAMDGPARVIRGLELDRTTVGDLRVTGTAGYFGFEKRYGKTYDPARYPGLG